MTGRPPGVHPADLAEALLRSHEGWALDLHPMCAEAMARCLLSDFEIQYKGPEPDRPTQETPMKFVEREGPGAPEPSPGARLPSVGRVVHYLSHGTPVRPDGSQAFAPACRAAIVTEVDPADPARVGLDVRNPTGGFVHPLAAGGCVHADAGAQVPGSWHWPEVV